jgi:putative PIN family toxin of toxin-antitoxin system
MKDKELPYVVIDTNVLISAGLLPNSQTAKVLVVALEHFVLVQNPMTWAELQKKITLPKFDKYFGDDGRLRFLARLAQNAKFLEPGSTAIECRDPKDNMFLALAVDANAKAIVSGDADLKDMNSYKGIDIYSPTNFFSKFTQLL